VTSLFEGDNLKNLRAQIKAKAEAELSSMSPLERAILERYGGDVGRHEDDQLMNGDGYGNTGAKQCSIESDEPSPR
jgi:hypothetical protein